VRAILVLGLLCFLLIGCSFLLVGCAPIRRLFPNTIPVADAGPDQSGVSVGSTVYLSGSGSDADGDDLDYTWYFFDSPSGSGATLYDWDRATAYFQPDLNGDYVFLLTVDDGRYQSVPDKVTITAP
jgi:hypothetical protein